ncbi:hypothetical protein [Nonomuraea sp. NPDC049625]|uniref:hypothetical protein n=1 Tax=Nonomuraea sp. NPDC049625 TaxID=3155775 RepID=UPI00344A6EBD
MRYDPLYNVDSTRASSPPTPPGPQGPPLGLAIELLQRSFTATELAAEAGRYGAPCELG